MGALLSDLRHASAGHALLRLLMLAGTGGFCAALAGAGTTAPLWLILLAVLGFASVISPHHSVPTVLMVSAAGLWIFTTEPSSAPWVLLAAVSLTVFHVSAALVSGVPAQADIPRDLWLRYGRRVVVLTAIATGTYLVYLLLRVAEIPGGPLPAALALALVAAGLVAHYLLVTRRAVADATATRAGHR